MSEHLDKNNWEVSVECDGETILTISSQHLSGIPNIEDYKELVLNCATHLAYFIGKPEVDINIATISTDELKALRADAERLDYLQSLTKGYGNGWHLRDSLQGRGMRLHESTHEFGLPTVRQAIDYHKFSRDKARNQ